MFDENYYDELKSFALDSDNYLNWRREHTKVFGEIFEYAFSQNEDAQICLTAALINISQRDFAKAAPKLDFLESICDRDFDETAVSYFKGLNLEMLGDEEGMVEYYDKLKNSSIRPKFILGLHPYYRTAKFAQRESECSKAVYYYRKALEFYDGMKPDARISQVASQIIYDIATVCLYMHSYKECARFLEYSYLYDSSKNQQRDYVKAILAATQGNRQEFLELVSNMNKMLANSCIVQANQIFNSTDPHYCVIPQDRQGYAEFWRQIADDEEKIRKLLKRRDTTQAERIISSKLTQALPFVKRDIACRIELIGDNVLVRCKSYCVKTLREEYKALFEAKPRGFENWSFISVDEFEIYKI